MFYTNKSIRLHSKALGYLELIQEANNRHEDKRSANAVYDTDKHRLINPMQPLNYSFNASYMKRMQNLSDWLVSRYQSVMGELGDENLRRMQARIKEMDFINEF